MRNNFKGSIFRKTILALIYFFCICIILLANSSCLAATQVQDKKDTSFSSPDLGSTKTYYVHNYACADVTGDGIKDQIIVIGKKVIDDASLEDVFLFVQNGKTHQKTKLCSSSGADPDLFIGDFNGDKCNDILLGVNGMVCGGAGLINYQIFAYQNGKFVDIFSPDKYSDGVKVETALLNDYKLQVTITDLKQNIIFDLKDRKSDYEKAGFYVKGKVCQLPETSPLYRFGRLDMLSKIQPKDIDGDGIYELIGSQYLAGQSHVDYLAMLKSTLKYDKQKRQWKLLKVWLDKNVEIDS